MSQSSSHPYQVDPAAAAALLEQANRSTAAAQGNAGWPSAVFLVGIGAVSSTVVAVLPWAQDHMAQRLLFVALGVWLVVLGVFLAVTVVGALWELRR